MNNAEMSDMIQKLSDMMNQSNHTDSANFDNTNTLCSDSENMTFNNIQNILSNMNSQSEDNNQDNNFNLDFDTIMKMKTMIDAINSSKNSPEANLLLSLKPYLNSNRKRKLDQYMQFLNIAKVIEAFNANGGVGNKWWMERKMIY